MNILSALLKCTSMGFLCGCVISTVPNQDNYVLPLAWLMGLVSIVLILSEVARRETEPEIAAAKV